MTMRGAEFACARPVHSIAGSDFGLPELYQTDKSCYADLIVYGPPRLHAETQSMMTEVCIAIRTCIQPQTCCLYAIQPVTESGYSRYTIPTF